MDDALRPVDRLSAASLEDLERTWEAAALELAETTARWQGRLTSDDPERIAFAIPARLSEDRLAVVATAEAAENLSSYWRHQAGRIRRLHDVLWPLPA